MASRRPNVPPIQLLLSCISHITSDTPEPGGVAVFELLLMQQGHVLIDITLGSDEGRERHLPTQRQQGSGSSFWTTPFPSLPSHKKRCPYRPSKNNDADSNNPTSSHSDTGLPALLMLIINGEYIRAGGRYCSHQFSNTCVLDSILAAFHVCYIKFQNVRLLLESNKTFKVLMSYLNAENYEDAKGLWLRPLIKFNKMLKFDEIDILGTVKDHFPVLAKLVCAEVDYFQATPDDHPVYQTTMSKFRALGDLKALGRADDPTMILVVPKVVDLPLLVEDEIKRTFELQFLLLGEGNHMVMCFNFSKNMWILYDNNPAVRSFRPFNLEQDLNRYMICWAGYINTTQAAEQNNGAPETGVGAQPFNCGSFGQRENPDEFMKEILTSLGALACDSSDSN